MPSTYFLRRIFQLPSWKLRLLLEASFYLLLARVALLVVPFRRIGQAIGPLQSPSSSLPSEDQEHIAQAVRVGRAVNTAADHAPIELVCLPRALAAWCMLRRRGLPSRVHFGALPSNAQSTSRLQTHAWLSSSGIPITGYPVAYQCVELGYYARPQVPAPASHSHAGAIS